MQTSKSRDPSTSKLVKFGQAVGRFLIAGLKWVQRDFIWSLLFVPVLYIALVYRLCDANFLGWSDSNVFKPLMEVVHPILLAGTLLVSLQSWRLTRDVAFAFLAVLSLLFLARELIGQGSSFLLYIAVIGLIIYGNRRSERIGSLLGSKWATSFLGMCCVCYLSSQLIDRGVAKRIGWLILWDTSWKLPHSSNLEEALESLGGFFLLCAPFAVTISRMSIPPRPDTLSNNQK